MITECSEIGCKRACATCLLLLHTKSLVASCHACPWHSSIAEACIARAMSCLWDAALHALEKVLNKGCCSGLTPPAFISGPSCSEYSSKKLESSALLA